MSTYSQKEFDNAYSTLNSEQKRVLDEHVRRGKKTKWLNIWARKKGQVLTEDDLNDSEKSMEKLLDWVLLNFEDNLTVNKHCLCECGRPLRYRYTVLHKETGKIYKLGIEHFKQHTGLSPEMVRLITKGLREIDLERDEILTKVLDEWKLDTDVPEGLEVPIDMIEQMNVGLPLLDRQAERLHRLIRDFIIANRANSKPELDRAFSKDDKYKIRGEVEHSSGKEICNSVQKDSITMECLVGEKQNLETDDDFQKRIKMKKDINHIRIQNRLRAKDKLSQYPNIYYKNDPLFRVDAARFFSGDENAFSKLKVYFLFHVELEKFIYIRETCERNYENNKHALELYNRLMESSGFDGFKL